MAHVLFIIIHEYPMMKAIKIFKIKQNIIYDISEMAHIWSYRNIQTIKLIKIFKINKTISLAVRRWPIYIFIYT